MSTGELVGGSWLLDRPCVALRCIRFSQKLAQVKSSFSGGNRSWAKVIEPLSAHLVIVGPFVTRSFALFSARFLLMLAFHYRYCHCFYYLKVCGTTATTTTQVEPQLLRRSLYQIFRFR